METSRGQSYRVIRLIAESCPAEHVKQWPNRDERYPLLASHGTHRWRLLWIYEAPLSFVVTRAESEIAYWCRLAFRKNPAMRVVALTGLTATSIVALVI